MSLYKYDTDSDTYSETDTDSRLYCNVDDGNADGNADTDNIDGFMMITSQAYLPSSLPMRCDDSMVTLPCITPLMRGKPGSSIC